MKGNKLLFTILLFSALMLGSCNSNPVVNTTIGETLSEDAVREYTGVLATEVPVDDIVADTSDTGIITAAVDTKPVSATLEITSSLTYSPEATVATSKEPVVEYESMEGVADGFSFANAKDISCLVVKKNSDYAIYPINGLSTSHYTYASKGTELLDDCDFSSSNMALIVGDISFQSGGIAGFNKVPRIEKISEFRPITVQDALILHPLDMFILDETEYDYNSSVWYRKDGSKYYIISAMARDKWLVTNGVTVSEYLSVQDVYNLFKWSDGNQDYNPFDNMPEYTDVPEDHPNNTLETLPDDFEFVTEISTTAEISVEQSESDTTIPASDDIFSF